MEVRERDRMKYILPWLFIALMFSFMYKSAFAQYRTWTESVGYDCSYIQYNGYSYNRVPRTCYMTCYYTQSGGSVSYRCN